MSDYLIPVVATLAVAWLWFAGRTSEETGRFQHAALHAFLALAVCQLVVAITNIAVGRPRPFAALDDVTVLFYEPINSSFPAHPVATVVAIGIAVWSVHPNLGRMVVFLGILLGAARIVAGLWYPTDVIGGMAVGWFSAWAAGRLLRRLPRAEAFIRRRAGRWSLG